MAAAAQECVVADDRRIIPVIGNSAVHVGHGLLTQIAAELTPKNGIKASKFVIVSDANVWALYGQQLVDSFLALGGFKLADCLDKPTSSEPGAFAMMCSCSDVPTEVGDDGKLLLTFQVPAGEGSKSRKVKGEIEDFMLRPMLTRTHGGLRTVRTGSRTSVLRALLRRRAACPWAPRTVRHRMRTSLERAVRALYRGIPGCSTAATGTPACSRWAAAWWATSSGTWRRPTCAACRTSRHRSRPCTLIPAPTPIRIR